MFDFFETPDDVAQKMATSLSAPSMDAPVVADLAVGSGVLLEAMRDHFGVGRFLGIDLDRNMISRLMTTHPWAHVFEGNSLHAGVVEAGLQGVGADAIDFAVLNPPFSGRGSSSVNVILRDGSINASLPTALLVRACDYLSIDGEAVAILPKSALRSQRDARARSEISRAGDFSVIGELPRRSFMTNTVSSAVVHFRKRRSLTLSADFRFEHCESGRFVPKRGNYRMHLSYATGEIPLVHTTNLREGSVSGVSVRVQTPNFRGPGILIPRVGLPSRAKIVVVPAGEELAMSDCVIGIETLTLVEAESLWACISESWLDFSSLYSSSCAPYITLDQVSRIVNRLMG